MGESMRISKVSGGEKPLATTSITKKSRDSADLGAVKTLKKKWSFGRVKEFFREKERVRQEQAKLLRAQFLNGEDEFVPTKFSSPEHGESNPDTLPIQESSSPRKKIKKNRNAQALRGRAWDALQTGKAGGRAIKRSVTDTTEQLQQRAQQTAQKLRDAWKLRRQEAQKLSDQPTPEELEEAKAKLAEQERYRNQLVAVCLPDQVRAGMGSAELIPFLQSVASGGVLGVGANRQKDLADLVNEKQRIKTGKQIGILPRDYAQGLLDCHAALQKNPALFGRNDVKSNWLPPELRSAFRSSGMSEPRKWLMKMNELRLMYNDIKVLERQGLLTQTPIDKFQEACRKEKVPAEIVVDESISLRQAFSYMTAWETAFEERDLPELEAPDGQKKAFNPDTVGNASTVTKLKEGQLRYLLGTDRPQLTSESKVVAELGKDKAAGFVAQAGDRFADYLLVEIYEQKLASESILNAKVTGLDWTFRRNAGGGFSVSYCLRATDRQGNLIEARGDAELDRKGEAVPASKIEVAVLATAPSDVAKGD